MTSLAGATAAEASSLDGSAANAAAPAVRNMFSSRWFDLDFDVGLSFPGSFGGSDFQNRGTRGSSLSAERTKQFLNIYAGLALQFGNFGIAASADAFRYDVELPEGTATRPGVNVTFTRFTGLAAYGFLENQLILGAGVRALTTGIQQFGGGEKSQEVLTFFGAAPEAGLIWKPNHVPLSFGATFRGTVAAAPIFVQPAAGSDVLRAGSFVLPKSVTAPWELELGFALQLGPRPLSTRWVNPHDEEEPLVLKVEKARAARMLHPTSVQAERIARMIEDAELETQSANLRAARQRRAANWPREKLLVLASLLVTGPSADSISVIGFVDQLRDPAGRRVSLSPRLGLETEPIADRMKVRLGTYLEPSRYENGFSRQHFTFGAEVKLFRFGGFWLVPELDICAIGAADLAPRYFSLGGSFCVWH